LGRNPLFFGEEKTYRHKSVYFGSHEFTPELSIDKTKPVKDSVNRRKIDREQKGFEKERNGPQEGTFKKS